MSEQPILWRNARIATCDANMREVDCGALITRGDRIEWVGEESALPEQWCGKNVQRRDLQRKWITPGLVDCHTHLVFADNRAHEWGQLLNGVSYEQIARAGGGILSTVKATRRASETELFHQSAPRLECLLNEGVTTVEIKSGYGLTLADERKMLQVARELAAQYPVTIKTTFLAAHTVPPEYAGRGDEYMNVVIEQWLPTLHDEGLVDAVDVFCEGIAFSVAQAEKLLEAASRRSLPIRMHADQLSNIGASRLAARFGALSCDHLEYASQEDVRDMAQAGTVAVTLPTAYLHLAMTQPPPVAELRKHEVPIAIGTDCNPGSSPSPSLLLAAGLGARLFKLTPHETLAGITRHAARALGESGKVGTLAAGHAADFAVWNVKSLDEIPYWLGRNTCMAVVRRGREIRGAVSNCLFPA